jgi:hypothetical protein
MSEKINSNPTIFAPTKTIARKSSKTSRYLWSDEGEFQSTLSLTGGDYSPSSDKRADDMDSEEGEEDEPIDSAEIFGTCTCCLSTCYANIELRPATID